MHDVRNQVQSLVQSIKNLGDQNIDIKNHVNNPDQIIKSNSQILGDSNLKNQVDLTSNQSDEKNSKNLDKSNQTKIQDHNNNIKNYESSIQSEMRIVLQKYKLDKDLTDKDKKDIFYDNDNFNKINKLQYLDLDISFDNESIQNDQNEPNKLIDSNSLQLKEDNKNFDNFNKEISELVKYSKDPYEMLNIIKFINYKINFLQHLELTFEQNQQIKNQSTNPSEILNQISKCMKILFINKKNSIILIFESKIDLLLIDIFMLKYFICQLSMYMHEYNQDINISLKILKNDDLDDQSQVINIIVNGFNQKNQNQRLDNSKIFENIILNLSKNVNYTQNFIESDNIHQINIQISQINKKIQPQSISNFLFQEKILIKNDSVEHIHSKNNTFVQDNKQIQIHNNHVFINVDDEINIQSMHTMLFKKRGISLLCCATERELKAVFLQVQAQFNPENKPKVVILLDNILDNSTGLELYRNLKMTLYRFNINVEWILLSSTEDQNTIREQELENINQVIEKPLTVLKLDNLLEKIGQHLNI